MESRGKWVIFLVAFDDPELEPQVIAEHVAADEDEQLSAFMRGGEVLEILPGHYSHSQVEGFRRELEKNCLR